MASIISNYSQFYRGTEQIKTYGSGAGQKTSVVRYEFNTTDEKGNKIMDKMSKEETYRTMNEISAYYGDNVIVEFSGDGLTAFEAHKGKIPLPEKPKREIPEDMITHLEGPKIVTEEVLQNHKGRSWDSVLGKIKEMSPDAYEEYQRLKAADEDGTQESRNELLMFQARWALRTEYPDLDVWEKIDANKSIKPQKGIMMTDFNYLFGSRMASIYGEKDDNGEYTRNYYSVSDTANNLLKTYASLYDEIVKGYEDGTRETYIEDSTAEGGYRKLTMDEELSELNKAYQKQVDWYASRREQGIEFLESRAKKLAEISKKSANAADKANEAYNLLEKYRNDPVPKDFTSKMVEAAQAFVVKYQANKGIGIDMLLQGIAIFNK